MFVKISGMAPGLANARPMGSAKFANAPRGGGGGGGVGGLGAAGSA